MKVNNFKRINKEDFDQDDRELVEKLSIVLTPFLEQVDAALNKNLDFDNLNQHYTNVVVRQVNGVPETLTQVKYPLKTRLKGIQLISAENLTDSALLTTSPFINYKQQGDLITITGVAGLPDNKQFRLSIILIG